MLYGLPAVLLVGGTGITYNQPAGRADLAGIPMEPHIDTAAAGTPLERPSWLSAPNLTEYTLDSEIVYRGPIFNIEKRTVQFPDGNTGLRDVLIHSGATTVLALDEDNRVLLTNQWRTALNRVNTELPAGKIDPGEEPLECALRELAEETGFTAESIEHIGSITTSAGFCDELLHIYVAHDLTPTNVLSADEDEFIELVWVDFDEVVDACLNGYIEDAKTIVAILMWRDISRRREAQR